MFDHHQGCGKKPGYAWEVAFRRGPKHRLGVTEVQGFHGQLHGLSRAQLEEGTIYMLIRRTVQCTICTTLHGRTALRLDESGWGSFWGNV